MAITTRPDRPLAVAALLAGALLGGEVAAQPVAVPPAGAASVPGQNIVPDPIQALGGRPAVPVPAASAPARGWRVAPAVKATATTTSNVAMQSGGSSTADTVVAVTPQLQVFGTTADYRLNGSVAADFVQYVGRSRADRIFPRGQVTLNTRLLERLVFLDGELGADTTSSTPFDLLGDGATYYNANTVTRERLSPYIDRELSPQSRITARSDHVLTQGRGNTAGTLIDNTDAYVRTNTARYDLRPQPFGLRADYSHQNTRYTDGTSSGLTLATAKVSALYSPDPALTLGITGGTDAARYTTNDVRETLRGGLLRWAPTDRTVFDAVVERRFFGTGWNATLTHRTPFMALSAGMVKQASTYAARLGSLQAGGNVPSMIDAILQTRIQDEVVRQAAVQDLMTKRGLPTTLNGPVDLFSRTVQLQQGVNVTLALVGVRHTVTVRVYQVRLQDLYGPNDDTPGILGLASDSIQRGVSLGLSRRLTPDTTADLTLVQTRTEGIGLNAALGTRSGTLVRLGATHALSPRTTVIGSVRHQTGSTALSTGNATETAVSAGVLHRF